MRCGYHGTLSPTLCKRDMCMTMASMLQPFRVALRWLLISLVGGLMVLMTTQVIMRYGFNASLLWAEELCRYMMLWLAFLAPVFALERGEIAALGMLEAALPKLPALLLATGTATVSLALCLLLTWFGWQYAQRAGQSPIPAIGFILESLFGPAAPPTPGRFWVYVALPVGMSLLSFRLAVDVVLLTVALFRNQTAREALDRDQTGIAE